MLDVGVGYMLMLLMIKVLKLHRTYIRAGAWAYANILLALFQNTVGQRKTSPYTHAPLASVEVGASIAIHGHLGSASITQRPMTKGNLLQMPSGLNYD